MTEGRPCVRGSPRHLFVPEVLRRCSTVASRQLQFLGTPVVQRGCFLESGALADLTNLLTGWRDGVHSFQCPSETTSMARSSTTMAVSSSIAYAGPGKPAAHVSALAMQLSGRST